MIVTRRHQNHMHTASSSGSSMVTALLPTVVKAASSTTRLVGKGHVWIPLNKGMVAEPYHAPAFDSNILSVGVLSDQFMVTFTSSLRPFNGCFIMDPTSRDIVWETPRCNGLYAMSFCNETERFHQMASLLIDASKSKSDVAMNWHERTGHIASSQYQVLAKQLDSLPFIEKSILDEIVCIPCLTGKMKRAPIQASTFTSRAPLELLHVNISDRATPSLGGPEYTPAVLDDFTAVSAVFAIKTKNEIGPKLQWFKTRSELEFDNFYRLKNIRLDRGVENKGAEVTDFCKAVGVKLYFSPPPASESNGAAEWLIQEQWKGARVLLFASKLPQNLWAEAIFYFNWLRNRCPSDPIDGRIPILEWNSRTGIDFDKVPVFGQPGYAFVYRSKTVAHKKFFPRSVFGHFVGMHSDITIIRVYVPHKKAVIFCCVQDFHAVNYSALPNVSSLLDGIARQSEVENISFTDYQLNEDGVEKQLATALITLHQNHPNAFVSKKTLADPTLPRSFLEACQDAGWREAIDREFNALVKRETWRLVPFHGGMNPVPFTWAFRKKPLDVGGKIFLKKARCCLRGDKQKPFVDYDPDTTYAPVTSHETLRVLLAFTTSQCLILEGADVANAYLYGKLDVPIIKEQPTDSTGKQTKPGNVFELQNSLYNKSWKFKVSNLDARLFFYKEGPQYIILALLVDHCAFASNSRLMLESFKRTLSASFDVKLYASLKTFIGWNISRGPEGIKVSQKAYALHLLKSKGLEDVNPVRTPLPQNADLSAARNDEELLSVKDHALYRSAVGGLLYPAVGTRPDISFSISALGRHFHAPTKRHLMLLKRVFRYIAGTMDHG